MVQINLPVSTFLMLFIVWIFMICCSIIECKVLISFYILNTIFLDSPLSLSYSKTMNESWKMILTLMSMFYIISYILAATSTKWACLGTTEVLRNIFRNKWVNLICFYFYLYVIYDTAYVINVFFKIIKHFLILQ